MTSLAGRIVVVAALALGGAPLFAQSPPPEATSQPRKGRFPIPAGVVPRPGHGEPLEWKTFLGAPQVVRLHCILDPHAMVMLPTGELKVIEQAKLQPTTKPFVAASPEEMAVALKASGLAKFKVEKAAYYFYVYDCSEGFFAHARSIMESMLPGVVGNLKAMGLRVERPDVPLVVVILPNRAAYDAYQRMPKGASAYYNILSNHVVMYEDQELWEAAPEYAAKKAGYIVAHEGVHQLLANTNVQRRLGDWRPWICEGLAEYYCPLKVNSSLIRKDNVELPSRTLKWTKAGMVNDLRMHQLLKLTAASGSVLKNLVEAEDIDADGYALAWGLVHYLATKKADAFRAYVADVSLYEPLDPATAPVAGQADPLFVKHFGNDFTALEREVQSYLNGKEMQAEYIDPFVNQTHYVVKCVQKVGRAFSVRVAVTTSPAAAKKWKEEQEAAHAKASFFTVVCKTRVDAEREVQKLK